MQHPPKKLPKRKKTRLLAALVILVLVLAVALVLLLPVIREAYQRQTLDYEIAENTVRMLDTRDAAQIERVTLYPDGQSGYTLHMQNGVLMLVRNGSLTAIAEDYQKEILKAVTEISVQNTVSEDASAVREHLEAMGLAAPQCKAVVAYADGRQEIFEVGAQIPGGVDYYFRWSGAEGVYTCHSGVLEALSTAPNLLIPFEQPVIYGALVERVSVENAHGTCTVAFEQDGSASLTSPVRYPVTNETAQTMLTAAQNVRLGAYEAELTDANRALYGFEAPLCTIRIAQAKGTAGVIADDGTLAEMVIPAQELCFVIGREEGEFFYTCAYQEQVYLVSRFLLKTLTELDYQSLLTRSPAAAGQNQLCGALFETPKKTVDIQITRTESVLANNELELDEEGNIVYLTSLSVNGQDMPPELLDELEKRLNGLTVEGDIPAGAVIESEPSWRVTLHLEGGRTRVLEGFRMDVFSDAVAVDGVMLHYVHNEAIDMLMSGLE